MSNLLQIAQAPTVSVSREEAESLPRWVVSLRLGDQTHMRGLRKDGEQEGEEGTRTAKGYPVLCRGCAVAEPWMCRGCAVAVPWLCRGCIAVL